jgi:hypothetical protein
MSADTRSHPDASPPDPAPLRASWKFENNPRGAAVDALVAHATTQASADAAVSQVSRYAREAQAAEVLAGVNPSEKVCDVAGNRQWALAAVAASCPSASVADVRVKLALLVRVMMNYEMPHESDTLTGVSLALAAGSLADLVILDGVTLTPPAECLRPVESDPDVAFWRQKAAEAEKREREAQGAGES